MSTEPQKWIEIWLDSSSERLYQPAFVSVLNYLKFDVLHNTNHNALEFGKDIICRDSGGTYYALQLKGNPGSRLNIGEWKEIYDQLIQLVSMPIPLTVSSTKRAVKHIPVLVTNGEVHENVRVAVDAFNRDVVPTLGSNAQPLRLWARGDLLSMFSKASSVAWPTSIDAQVAVLKSISQAGEDSMDLRSIQQVIADCLQLKKPERVSSPQSRSLASSLAVISNIMSTPQLRAGNIYECIKLKTIVLVNIIAFFERNDFSTKYHEKIVTHLRADLFDNLNWYTEQIATGPKIRTVINENLFAEFGILTLVGFLLWP